MKYIFTIFTIIFADNIVLILKGCNEIKLMLQKLNDIAKHVITYKLDTEKNN